MVAWHPDIRTEGRGSQLRPAPIGYLSGLNTKFLGDLLHGFQSPEGLQGYAGLELGVMLFACVLHGLDWSSGCLTPSHNHYHRIP